MTDARPRRRFDPRPHARGDGDSPTRPALSAGFDPRPHARGDIYARVIVRSTVSSGFDPRPHARGDGALGAQLRAPLGFDPRPHARGYRCGCRRDDQRVVSIHAPTREGDLRPITESSLLSCFDPRPHARGDSCLVTASSTSLGSIHAPTRGATRSSAGHSGAILQMVSIHAPTRGGDSSFRLICETRAPRFRSTPPREGRQRSPPFQSAHFDA